MHVNESKFYLFSPPTPLCLICRFYNLLIGSCTLDGIVLAHCTVILLLLCCCCHAIILPVLFTDCLQKRGMYGGHESDQQQCKDCQKLLYYPYREDGLLLHKKIQSYVTEYIDQ